MTFPLRRLSITLCVAGFAAAAPSACATLGRQAFQAPTVELRDVKLRSIGLDGGALDLVLDVHNANEYRLDATRLTYTLIADTAVLARGAITKRVTLTPRARSEVTLPMTFTMRELMGAAEVLVRTGRVNYTVRGEVTVDTPFGSATRPYEGKALLETGSLIRP